MRLVHHLLLIAAILSLWIDAAVMDDDDEDDYGFDFDKMMRGKNATLLCAEVSALELKPGCSSLIMLIDKNHVWCIIIGNSDSRIRFTHLYNTAES